MAFSVGSCTIGDGAACFVIAEAGSNHNGDYAQAVKLIDAAASAGADAVKFQVFRASRLYPRQAGASGYLKSPESIYDIIERMEMPYAWLPKLAADCARRGIAFMASAFDEESVDRLDPFVAVHKIASYELTHLPLIAHVAAKGKPVILSTGTADMEEVARAVEVCRRAGNASIALLQCTAAYPAPLESLNVRAMDSLQRAFGVAVGLSDHSRQPLAAPMAAAALGAAIIEKHFTLSNRLPGPDHAFAVEPQELAAMVRGIHEVERALGSGQKQVQGIEQELRRFARRSIFARRPIAAGEAFTADNVAVLRCGNLQAGLPPACWPQLLGRRALRPLAAEEAVREGDYV